MGIRIGIMVVDYDIYLKVLSRIKNEISKGRIEVIAITNGWLTNSSIGIMDGFKYFDLGIFLGISFDYLIVAAGDDEFVMLKNKLGNRIRCGVDRVLSVRIFEIIDFDFSEYAKLLESKVSIISYNCWGGLTYAYLHLRFNSPTINTRFENEEHYIKFVSDLDHYLSVEPVFDGTEYEDAIGEYPAGKIDDVRIRFVHYKSFKEAVRKWNERKQRINRDNIFLMLFTENREIARSFDKTGDYRKVVFTAGDYGVKSQIDLSALFEISQLSAVGRYAVLAANGELHLYNAIKMLNGDGDFIETKLRVEDN